jgi:hypothetical protein
MNVVTNKCRILKPKKKCEKGFSRVNRTGDVTMFGDYCCEDYSCHKPVKSSREYNDDLVFSRSDC